MGRAGSKPEMRNQQNPKMSVSRAAGYRGQNFGPSGEDCPPAHPEARMSRASIGFQRLTVADASDASVRCWSGRRKKRGELKSKADSAPREIGRIGAPPIGRLAAKRGPINGPPGLPSGVVADGPSCLPFDHPHLHRLRWSSRNTWTSCWAREA